MASDHLRVLVLEDDPDLAVILKNRLQRAAQETGTQQVVDVHIVDRLAGAKQSLAKGAFDVLLLDLNVPDSQGLATFDAVHGAAGNTPIVILTSIEDQSMAEEAVKRGAQNFLVKGNQTPEALLRALVIARTQAQRA